MNKLDNGVDRPPPPIGDRAPMPAECVQVPEDRAVALHGEIKRAMEAGRHDAARQAAERLVALAPTDAAAWNALGIALRASGKPEAAIAAYARALQCQGAQPHILGNWGNALKDLQRLDEAIAVHKRAVALEPRASGGFANLGVALREAGRIDEALAAFDTALALDPANLRLQFDRAQLLLMRGDYEAGWPAFEARWHRPEMQGTRFTQPLWDGRTLPDKTILLWPEQGFGDTILCARFVRLVKRRVGRVMLGCQPELVRLFQGLDGVDAIVPYGAAVPPFDVHCPLMSLPRFFSPDLGQIPAPARLHVPHAARAKLAPVLAQAGGRLKVGIVWSGSVTFRSNHLRATSVERFLDFAAVPGVQLFSLQKGLRAAELAESGAGALVIDLAPYLHDFADTAAAIEGLDLVIMTDSSVAHLAGSLGTPIWNLLPFAAYWLYLKERADTPWYPSMRLFRQAQPGDWDGVFRQATVALEQRVRQRAAQSRGPRAISSQIRVPQPRAAFSASRECDRPAARDA